MSGLFRHGALPVAWLSFAIGISCTSTGPNSALPPFPALNLESFSPAVRSEFQKAEAAAREAPNDAGKAGSLGMLLHAHDRLEAAAACYGRAHLLRPKEFRWLYYLGVAESGAGKNNQAIDSFRRALALDSNYVAGHSALADLLRSANDDPAAGKHYEMALRLQENYAPAFYGLGRIHFAAGDAAKAAEYYSKACQLQPRYAAARYGLALAYRQLGRRQEAEKHFAIYNQDPSAAPPASDSLLSQVHKLGGGALRHIAQGKRMEAAGKLREAVAAHLEAIAIDPGIEQAHINLISLYGRLGEPDSARKHYQRAVELNPKSGEAHYNYGVLASSASRQEAQAAYRKVIAINPAHAEAHNNLGFLLQWEGRKEEALQHYRKALESKPGYERAHFNAGMILLERKRFPDAIRHFEAALAREDENTARYLFALAVAHAKSGNPGKALDYARRAEDKARLLGQEELRASIERDIRKLERSGGTR